jgi:hypothetical protein
MKKTQRKHRQQCNDYYRGAADAKANRQPQSNHARMSRATMAYMAGYNDTTLELSHGRA